MEPEFYRMAPDGVSTHANRVALKDVTPDALLAMENDAVRSALGIASVRVGVLAFGSLFGTVFAGSSSSKQTKLMTA